MQPLPPTMIARPNADPPRARRRARRGASRGFTLAEMFATMAVIGVLATAASPVFIGMARDRRVNHAALQTADMYRTARTRALGRGMPVLIRWDENAGLKNQATGLFTVIEPVIRDYANVNTSCTAISWSDVTKVYNYAQFDVGDGRHERTEVKFKDDTAVDRPAADICFTPRGRAYLRTTGGFAALSGVPSFTVKNTHTGLVRTVYVPPSGEARVVP